MTSWTRAIGSDVTELVSLSQSLFECEVDQFYRTDPTVLARNLTLAIVNQFYNPNSEYVVILRDQGRLIAYLWLVRNQFTPWSDDEVLEFKIAHLDLSLPVKQRIRIINEMIDQSILFAHHNNIPLIVSSTVRESQVAFLKLHEKKGFTIRGSCAYLRLLNE